jgi:phosphoribosylpyrophosphate synthetase
MPQCPKVKVLDVSELIAEAIKRIHYNESVSTLFV